MEKGFTTLSGSKIYYEKSGNGEPLIFVHADTLDARQWNSQFDYFSSLFTVIRFDIRGFGKSDVPTKEPYCFSEDLYEFMKSLSIQKAHLIGSSLGAAVSIDFVLTHPEKVHSLVLADAGISGDGFNETFMNSIKHITDLAKSGDLNGAKLTWLNLDLFNFSRTLPRVWKQVEKMVHDTSGYRWQGENQPTDIDPPAVQRLSNIQVPTLVIVGEGDIDDFQRKARLIHEKISGSQFVSVPHAGHLSNMDNSEAFNQTIGPFLVSAVL
jgi:3-oxoadipate enol-lactonase